MLSAVAVKPWLTEMLGAAIDERKLAVTAVEN